MSAPCSTLICELHLGKRLKWKGRQVELRSLYGTGSHCFAETEEMSSAEIINLSEDPFFPIHVMFYITEAVNA